MTQLQHHRADEPRTYGNWQPPRSAGFGSLGLLGSAVAVGGTMVAVLIMWAGQLLIAAVVAGVVALIVLTLMFRDRHGLNVGQRIGARLAWRRTKAAGAHLYQSGPLSAIPYGKHTLPGVGAQTVLTEHRDSWDRPFAMIEVPSTGDYTTVYSGEPAGAALVDPETIDNQVDHWGGWLAGCADEDDLVAASITIEARPDTGARLRSEVESNVKPTGHELARQIMAKMVDHLPAGSSTVRAWATTTFSATPRHGGKRRDTAEMALELATRVPVIADGLRATGAGAARPTTAAELCEVVRTAYDPELAATFDAARAAGEALDLSWDDVGPTATRTEWGHLVHDGGISVTWYMSLPPKGKVRSSVLARLLAPHPACEVKRVTLLYRPLDVGEAADVVQDDLKNAAYRVNNPSGGPATQADKTSYLKAEKTADEEADGAAVTNFAMVVTATITAPEKLRELNSVVSGLTRNAKILVRVAHGSQASAFQFGLPIGLVPAHHVSVPESMRKGL